MVWMNAQHSKYLFLTLRQTNHQSAPSFLSFSSSKSKQNLESLVENRSVSSQHALLMCIYVVFFSLFQMWPMQTRQPERFGAIRSSLPLRRCFLLCYSQFVLHYCADLFLLTLVCFSSTPVTQSWRSRGSLKVKSSWHFHRNDVSQ